MPKGDSRIHEIKIWWVKEYEKKYGIPHPWAGKEAKFCKDLLAYCEQVSVGDSLDTAKEILVAFLKDPKPAFHKHPFSWACKMPHQWWAEVRDKRVSAAKRKRTVEVRAQALSEWRKLRKVIEEKTGEISTETRSMVEKIGGMGRVETFVGTDREDWILSDFVKEYETRCGA